MTNLLKKLSFLRWHLKPLRYLGKFIYSFYEILNLNIFRKSLKDIILPREFFQKFYIDKYISMHTPIPLPNISLVNFQESEINHNKSFTDVKEKYWTEISSYVSKILLDEELNSVITNYFKKEDPQLWNISLNLSRKSDGLLDSQYWHFDYGDLNQLHFMIYFSDVTKESGPFTFLNYRDSTKIKRSFFWIERLLDNDLLAFDCNSNQSIKAIGDRGTIFIADPGKLLHQGARCLKDRLVLFISLTSSAPMSRGGKNLLSRQERLKLFEDYKSLNKSVYSRKFFGL